MFIDVEALKRDVAWSNQHQSEIAELRALVAELEAEKVKSKKKANIPWFSIGFFGSRILDELKKKK